jgi:hypothetical protein
VPSGVRELLGVLSSSGVEGWNLLRTASLFLGQIPVASKDFLERSRVKAEVQAAQNIKKKSPFLTASKPRDLWVRSVSWVEYPDERDLNITTSSG